MQQICPAGVVADGQQQGQPSQLLACVGPEQRAIDVGGQPPALSVIAQHEGSRGPVDRLLQQHLDPGRPDPDDPGPRRIVPLLSAQRRGEMTIGELEPLEHRRVGKRGQAGFESHGGRVRVGDGFVVASGGPSLRASAPDAAQIGGRDQGRNSEAGGLGYPVHHCPGEGVTADAALVPQRSCLRHEVSRPRPAR